MYALITIISYALDVFIIYTYLNNVLKDRKSAYKFFFPAILLVEVILFINETLIAGHPTTQSTLITIIISTITTFFLTFFFNAGFMARIFAALSFQILATISEYIFTFIINTVNRGFFSIPDRQLFMAIMNIGSKILLFLCAIIVGLFWKKRNSYPMEYNILLLSTPIISLVLMAIMPAGDIAKGIDSTVYLIMIIALVLLNIINYVLIDKVYRTISDQNEKNLLMNRLELQNDSYVKLSESYKQSRRIIHDVKKHYFTIGEYALKNNDIEVSEYVKEALENIESTYIRYNTGNLVIDSMLTSYGNVAESKGISFEAELHVNNKHVPVRDYDLSIIFGNLLDNAIHAATGSTGMYIRVTIETRDDNRFLITCENSVAAEAALPVDNNDPGVISEHGYGLSNIHMTVDRYYGFMSCEKGNPWIVNIVIPTMTDRSICPPPRHHQTISKQGEHNDHIQ